MMMKKFLKPFAGLATAWSSNDFLKAKIQLTAFYMLILFGILVFFSSLLHWQVQKNLSSQISQITLNAEQIKNRIQSEYPQKNVKSIDLENENGLVLYSALFEDDSEIRVNPLTGIIMNDGQDYENFFDQFNASFTDTLWILNVIILFFSAFFSYFLAGKTLHPIQAKVNEQRRFIADAAHELKNPLSAIHASSESVLRVKHISDHESQEVFREILEESGRLISLADQLLCLDQRKIQSKIYASNIKDIIESVLKKISPLAKHKNILFQKNLFDTDILLAEKDFEIMLFNLLHNAIKFSHKNSHINISFDDADTLSVQDFGKGINQKDLSHIFERFYKADRSRVFDKDSGSGLGLSIVKEICDRNKWHIETESSEYAGSTFRVIF